TGKPRSSTKPRPFSSSWSTAVISRENVGSGKSSRPNFGHVRPRRCTPRSAASISSIDCGEDGRIHSVDAAMSRPSHASGPVMWLIMPGILPRSLECQLVGHDAEVGHRKEVALGDAHEPHALVHGARDLHQVRRVEPNGGGAGG